MSILIITFVITFYFLNMTIYHFSQLVHRQAEKYGKRTAFRHKDKVPENGSLLPGTHSPNR